MWFSFSLSANTQIICHEYIKNHSTVVSCAILLLLLLFLNLLYNKNLCKNATPPPLNPFPFSFVCKVHLNRIKSTLELYPLKEPVLAFIFVGLFDLMLLVFYVNWHKILNSFLMKCKTQIELKKPWNSFFFWNLL